MLREHLYLARQLIWREMKCLKLYYQRKKKYYIENWADDSNNRWITTLCTWKQENVPEAVG